MRISISSYYHRLRSILRPRGKSGTEGGQAMVEFAVAMPLLIIVMLGAAEFGWLAYESIEVSNAAMGAASYGAQTAVTAADSTGIGTAAAADAPDLTLGTTSSSVSCICANGNASTCKSTDCSGSAIEQILTVNTSATVNPLIRLPGFPTSFTIHGQAVQKVLQ